MFNNNDKVPLTACGPECDPEDEGGDNSNKISKDCDIDAVSSSGFHHPGLKVISPTGDDALKASGEPECPIHNDKLGNRFTTDELEFAKVHLEGMEEEDIEMERKFIVPPII